MVVSKDILVNFKSNYDKVIRLITEESKNDPDTDPYRSHNAAKDILLEIKSNLEKEMELERGQETNESNERDVIIYTTLKAVVYHDLGCSYIFTEEKSMGFQYLRDCLEMIQEYRMEPETIIVHMDVLNELAVAYINIEEFQKAADMLMELETIYQKCKELNIQPLQIDDICRNRNELQIEGDEKQEKIVDKDQPNEEHLEKVYTLSCLHRAKVYSYLKEFAKSAHYCHLTLKRQLITKCYDPVEFATNSQALSNYFLDENMFREARHHLAAATLMLAEYESQLNEDKHLLTAAKLASEQERFKGKFADLANQWCRYGLALLQASRERLILDDEDLEKLAKNVKVLKIDSEMDFVFKDLALSVYEDRISCDYCLVFDDAKQVFHFVLKWLETAKEYYKPETNATDYSKVIRQYAELYENIVFFEADPINQAKMQKRRAKYYEELIELLNPKHYLSIYRECTYGAGLAYSAIFDIKVDLLSDAKTPPDPRELYRFENIRQSGIKHFRAFIDSFPSNETDGQGVKDDLNDDISELRTKYFVYFYLGRLYYKTFNPDLKMQCENLTKSLQYYQLFIDECSQNEKVADTMKAEIGVCKEMVNLLPLKIANLEKRIPKS